MAKVQKIPVGRKPGSGKSSCLSRRTFCANVGGPSKSELAKCGATQCASGSVSSIIGSLSLKDLCADLLGRSIEPIPPCVLVDRLRDHEGRVAKQLRDVEHVDAGVEPYGREV